MNVVPSDVRAVRLLAVGDLQLGDSATCVGFGFRSKVSPTALETALRGLFSKSETGDLVFANLETPLSDIGLDPRSRRSRQLRGRPEYAATLRSSGFTVLNVANNHALEHGERAFADSVSRVESLGIEVCGQRGGEGWTARPVTQLVRSTRVSLLSYTLRRVPGESGARSCAQATEAEILADVARLRLETDCVVVSLHWGEEFVPLPSASEVAFAHAVIDAGASVLLGHHPHVARPVERYRNAVIAYSLGNFAADMIWYDPLRRGLMLECELTPRGVGAVHLHEVRIDPSYLPRAVGQGDATPRLAPVNGMPGDEYIREARRTVQAQRRALYGYTVRNAWRFDPRVLLDLTTSTVRAKLAGLTSGSRDEIWG